MKKTRNAFFQESNYQSFNPNMNNPAPYQTASNYFYQGPMPNNYNTNNMSLGSDIESRLSKIERQINRLDYRLSKLENNTTLTVDDYDTPNSNMYMV